MSEFGIIIEGWAVIIGGAWLLNRADRWLSRRQWVRREAQLGRLLPRAAR